MPSKKRIDISNIIREVIDDTKTPVKIETVVSDKESADALMGLQKLLGRDSFGVVFETILKEVNIKKLFNEATDYHQTKV